MGQGMAEQESSKQAAITADSGVNQGSLDVVTNPLVIEEEEEAPALADLGGAANEGVSERFSAPKSPKHIRPAYAQHPSFYRKQSGEVISSPISRRSAQRAEKYARAYPDLDSEYMSNVGARTIGDRDILTREELQAAEDPGMLESIGLFFEPFDMPRRALWGLAAKAGEWLPDPGSMAGDAMQSVVGVVGGLALSATIGVTEGAYSPIGKLGSLFDDEEDEPLYPRVPGIELVDGFQQMAENLYGSIATGEIDDRAAEHLRPWFWPLGKEFTTAGVVSGESLIDAMISREQAWELSQMDDIQPHLKAFARHVSTDVGRLAYGLVAEIALDPLWWTGPGKAGNAARQFIKAGKIYGLSGRLGKSSGTMEMLARGTNVSGHNSVVGDLLIGSLDEVEDASNIITKYSELASASVLNLRANLDQVLIDLKGGGNLRGAVRRQADLILEQEVSYASKYKDLELTSVHAKLLKKAETKRNKIYAIAENPESASRWLNKHTKTLTSDIKTFDTHVENLTYAVRTTSEARAAGTAAKHISEKGFLSVHLPFSGKHHYFFKEGPLDKFTTLINGSPRATKFIDDYSLSSLEAQLTVARMGIKDDVVMPFTEVFKGNQGALLAYTAQKTLGHAMALPAVAWDILVQMFGTRYIQPLMVSMSIDAAELAGKVGGTKFAGKYYQRLKKVSPEVWDEYQEAITTMMNAYGGLQMRLQSEMDRLSALGKAALSKRRKEMPGKIKEIQRKIVIETDVTKLAELRRELVDVRRWSDKRAYTLNDLLLEVGSELEVGAGKFGKLSPAMKEVASDLRKLVDEIVSDPAVIAGKLQVEQALVSIVRHAKDDPERRIKLLAALQVVNDKMEGVSTIRSVYKGRAQKALLKRMTQLKSLREGLEGVDRDVLVKLVEKVKSLAGDGGYDPSVHSEYIYEFLIEATQSKVAARQILRRFAIALGETDGGTALAKLVERLTGTFEYAKNVKRMSIDKALERSINTYLKDLKAQYIALRNSYKKGPGISAADRAADTIGDLEFMPGMSRKDFQSLVARMIEDNDDTWKLMVPREQHPGFMRWIDGDSQLSPPPPPKPIKPEPKGRVTPSDSQASERVEALLNSTAKTVPPEEVISGLAAGGQEKYYSASTVIDHFSDAGFGSEYGPLMAYLKNSMGTDVVVHFVDDASMWQSQSALLGSYGAYMSPVKGAEWSPLRRVILIDVRATAETRIVEALTHELFHAATANRYSAAFKGHLDGAVGPAEEVASDIRKLYNFFAEGVQHDKLDSELSRLLEKVTSPEELIAYGLTNPRVAEYLNGIEYATKAQMSLFNVLLEKIKALFMGTNPTSANAELARLVDKLLDGPDSFIGTKSDLAMAKITKPEALSDATSKTRGGFGFESSNNPVWDRARSYYERAQHLRSLRSSTGKLKVRSQNEALEKGRREVLDIGSGYAGTEGSRLSSELAAKGVRINKEFRVKQGSPWHLKVARPVAVLKPVVIKPAVAAPPPPAEPVPKPIVEAKPKSVTNTEPALASHEAPKPVAPKRAPATAEGAYTHQRGSVSHKGIYRSRYTTEEYRLQRIDTAKGSRWQITPMVTGADGVKSAGKPLDKLTTTKERAGEYLRNEVDLPTAGRVDRTPVVVKTKRVKVERGGKIVKDNHWVDPNTNDTWVLSSVVEGKGRVWTATNKTSGKELVFRAGSAKEKMTLPRASEGLQEYLNTTRGSLEETPAVQKVINETIAKNDEAGILFTKPVVQSRMTQAATGNINAEELFTLGFERLDTEKYVFKVNDVLALAGADESFVWRVHSIRKGKVGTYVDFTDHTGEFVSSNMKLPIKFEDEPYFLLRDAATVTKKKKTTAIGKAGKPELTPALQSDARRYVQPPADGKIKDVTVELPLNPKVAADNGWVPNLNANNRFQPIGPGVEIAIYNKGVLEGGGKVASRTDKVYTLESGETIAFMQLNHITKGHHEGIVALVKRPVSKSKAAKGKRDARAVDEEAGVAYEASTASPLDLTNRPAEPSGLPSPPTPKNEDNWAGIVKGRVIVGELEGKFPGRNVDTTTVWKRLFLQHAKGRLNTTSKDLTMIGGKRPDAIHDNVRYAIETIENRMVEGKPLLEKDIKLIADAVSDVRAALGGPEDLTLYRKLLEDMNWRAAPISDVLGTIATRLETSLDGMGSLKPFHESLYRLEIGILRSDAKGIEAALNSLEAGVLSGKRTAFPDVGTFAMSKDEVANQLTAEAMRLFRVRRALKDASPKQIAESLLKIMSKGESIDPVARRVLMKALRKEGHLLKKVFNDPNTTLAKVDAEIATMKTSISKFMELPDGVIPTKLDEIGAYARVAGMDEGGEFTTNAAGKLFGATWAKEGAKVSEQNILSKGFKDRRTQIRNELEGMDAPHIELRPDVVGDEAPRVLEAWENRLWEGARKLFKEHNLTREQELMASFTVLREVPKLVNKDSHAALAKLYPSLMGQRFTTIDPTLEPVMRELESIIQRYEAEYALRGYGWVADRERILEDWGVLEFVPHLYKETDTAALRSFLRGKVTHGHGKGTDQVLWIGKDVNEQRKLAGSILELKALQHAGHDKVATLDPLEIFARYSQVNRSMTNEDFLITLINTKVIRAIRAEGPNPVSGLRGRTVEEIAEAEDLVPLFSRPDVQRTMDLLNRGTREQWLAAGLGPDDVARLLEEQKTLGKEIFATYLNSSPKIRAIRKVEQATLRIRAEQLRSTADVLFEPRKLYRERAASGKLRIDNAWESSRGQELRAGGHKDDVTDILRQAETEKALEALDNKIWDDLAGEANVLLSDLKITAPKMDAGLMRNYFDADDQFWELYIPNGVVKNMENVLEMGDEMSGILGSVGSLGHSINAFWKTRVTVTSVAFSFRNAISNSVSNILDLGIYGGINYHTNKTATQLSSALLIKEEYGSIANFVEKMAALPAVKAAPLRAAWKSSGLSKLYENGVDFKNGIVMQMDDVLDDMVDHGVLSPAFMQFTDLSRAEVGVLQNMAGGTGGVRGALSKKVFGADLEDLAVVSLTSIMTGGIPVALPKAWGGKFLSRVVENQARAANFMGNFKKTGVWSDAAAHANKFLFDYGDLTKFQRSVMRLVFPFFTWNIKNVHLQFEMMQKSPHFYANFHRLMSDGLPQVFEATQNQSQGKGYIKSEPLDLEVLRLRESHYSHTIGLPFPSLEGTPFGKIPAPYADRNEGAIKMGTIGKNYLPLLKNAKIQGLGLPQEGLMNTLGLVSGFVDPRNWGAGMFLPDALGGRTAKARSFSDRKKQARIVGEVHFLLRLMIEQTMGHQVFYDKPIAELTDGRIVGEILRGVEIFPMIGPPIKTFMEDKTGLRTYSYYDKFNKRWRSKVHVYGQANYTLGSLPWMRNFRDAAAATEMFFASQTLPMQELHARGMTIDDHNEVPFAATLLDALSGLNVKQVDPESMKHYSEMRADKMRLNYLKSIGLVREFSETYVPYK